MERIQMDCLMRDEREQRWKKVRIAMEKQGIHCLIVWGSFGFHRGLGANIRYLSNVITEGYLVFPLKDEPTLITFLKGHDLQSWVTDWRSGHPVYSKIISERLKELCIETSNIGIVGLSGYYGEWGFPHTTYESLRNTFPKVEFTDATKILEKARMIKSPTEIRCFELGCEAGDKVIQAILNVAKAGVKDYQVRAKIMDALFKRGCEPGSMVLYCSGKQLQHAGQGGYFKSPDNRELESGDVILVEFDARYLGYIAQYNQPFSVGEPDKEWRKTFDIALQSFNNGLKTLRPGITVKELDQAFLLPIKEAGYTYTHPSFHGLGLSLEEPIGSFPAQPEYKPDKSLVIEAGMVIEFEPHPVSADGKRGIHLGSSVLVTDTGCRLLSKYWKPEFKVV